MNEPGVREEPTVGYKASGSAGMTDTSMVRTYHQRKPVCSATFEIGICRHGPEISFA